MAADALLNQTRPLRADFFEKENKLIAQLAREGQKPQIGRASCRERVCLYV